MSRLALLAGALFAGLTLAVLALQVPAARPVDAPPTVFAAGRAMVDIRRIADEPHPVGTPAHAEVRAWLFGRMTELDLAPEVQVGVLSPEASQRLERWSDGAIAGYSRIFNLVGVMPGRDRNAPAVLLMAHYDTSWNSPGAADDSAGVAAILEAVRVLQAEGPFERDLVVLLTDAEELNLDGARAFFSEHPLRDRIGLVINLEARGGGGRAMMFETGPGNAETVALFARAAGQVEGGVTGNALATLVYENMPNGTDYTIPKARGIAGLNIAFIGRPDQYHSPASTPEALDPGALQHLGDQALTLARLALTAEALPQATRNVVFADLLGRVVLVHPAGLGWGLLAVTLAAFGLAVWRWRDEASPAAIGRGAIEALFATVVAVIAAWAYSAEPVRLKRSGWWGPGLVGLCYEGLPWFTGAAVVAAGAPRFEVVATAALYAFGAHGIMTLNDFKALEGDRVHGVRSLPVTLGPEVAAKIACIVMVLAQLLVVSMLIVWGRPLHAGAVAVLIAAQIAAMRVLMRDPRGRAPWYNGTGVVLYVAGMMVSAFALASLPVRP